MMPTVYVLQQGTTQKESKLSVCDGRVKDFDTQRDIAKLESADFFTLPEKVHRGGGIR